jgi:D-sedoheptulose 7-phosphate isomerase
MHLCEELIGRYKRTRIPLPALCLNSDATALTCIANDFGFEQVYSRQVQGLGKSQDILVCFTTSGNSPNILAAIDASTERGVQTILVSGKDGGKASGRCTVEIIVPSTETARIQEVHTLILHHWLEKLDLIYANV